MRADVNGSNAEYSHWSPLLLAADPQRGRSRRALLRRGAEIGLVEALALGDDARVLRLLRRGRGALPAVVPGDASLIRFARTRTAIDRLLELGVSIDKTDKWGATPIDTLSHLGRRGASLVRHLADRGARIDPEIVARLGDRRMLARLVAIHPAIVGDPRVVSSAAQAGHRALVAWLLDRGASPDARSARASHDTCLHAAAWNGDLAMVELLLARGADPTLLDDEHRTTPQTWAEVALGVTNNPACRAVAERLQRATAST
jgi:hypothetical protein